MISDMASLSVFVKKVTKLSMIYVIGDVVAKASYFLLLPLYTRFITPENYGVISVAGSIMSVLNATISFGMERAIVRFYFLYKDELKRKRFYGSIWMFLLLVSLFVALVLTMFGQSIFALLFHNVPFDPYIRLVIWVVFLDNSFALMPLALFRARDQAFPYVFLNLIKVVTMSVSTVLFVVLFRWGAVGYIYGQLVSSAIVAIVGLLTLLKDVIPNLRFGSLKPALAYGMPFVPHMLSQWLLSVSDRVILEKFVSLEQLGIYSLGFQFGLVLQLAIAAINKSLIPVFGRSASSDYESGMLSRMVTYYALATTCMGLGLILLAQDVIRLVMPASYHDAGAIVTWVVFGYLATVFYYPSMNMLTMVAGRTKAIPIVTMISGFLNISLNLLLVPHFGIIAAAVNNAVGYIVLTLLMFFWAQHVKPLDYEYKRLSKMLLSGVLVVFLGFFLMRFDSFFNIIIGLTLMALYPLILGLLGFWTRRERKNFAELVLYPLTKE